MLLCISLPATLPPHNSYYIILSILFPRCLFPFLSSSLSLPPFFLSIVFTDHQRDLTEETNADLQDLNLSICDIHDKSIIKIVARYTALKSLYLEGLTLPPSSSLFSNPTLFLFFLLFFFIHLFSCRVSHHG